MTFERFRADLSLGAALRSGAWRSSLASTTCARRSPRVVIPELVRRSAHICAYSRSRRPGCSAYSAARRARFLPKVNRKQSKAPTLSSLSPSGTEFPNPDFDHLKTTLKAPLVFDGRNLYDPALMKSFGIDYQSIERRGWAVASTSARTEAGTPARPSLRRPGPRAVRFLPRPRLGARWVDYRSNPSR